MWDGEAATSAREPRGVAVRRRFGFSNVELRVAGRNLYTWTDYTGVDPETSVQSAGTSVIRGVDYFNNPQTRSFIFTVNLNR